MFPSSTVSSTHQITTIKSEACRTPEEGKAAATAEAAAAKAQSRLEPRLPIPRPTAPIRPAAWCFQRLRPLRRATRGPKTFKPTSEPGSLRFPGARRPRRPAGEVPEAESVGAEDALLPGDVRLREPGQRRGQLQGRGHHHQRSVHRRRLDDGNGAQNGTVRNAACELCGAGEPLEIADCEILKSGDCAPFFS